MAAKVEHTTACRERCSTMEGRSEEYQEQKGVDPMDCAEKDGTPPPGHSTGGEGQQPPAPADQAPSAPLPAPTVPPSPPRASSALSVEAPARSVLDGVWSLAVAVYTAGEFFWFVGGIDGEGARPDGSGTSKPGGEECQQPQQYQYLHHSSHRKVQADEEPTPILNNHESLFH